MSKHFMTVLSDIKKLLQPGDRVMLHGGLGSGKTTLVSEIVHSIGSSSPVSSPTFTLIHHYDHAFPIYHMDLYRMDTVDAIHYLDLDTYFNQQDALIFVEWADRLGPFYPKEYFKIELTLTSKKRTCLITAKGTTYQSRLKKSSIRTIKNL